MPAPLTSTSRSGSADRPVTLRALLAALLAIEGTLALCAGYLLVLLLAAARAATRGGLQPAPQQSRARLRLVVLVPAHDEQDGIAANLESLARCEYPGEARRVVVIADNCTDRTADRARRAGAEVWERVEPAKRGKGFALAWALERLKAERDTFDGVVILDADCRVSVNLLGAIEQRLRAGASAVQVDDVIGNPGASDASALRFAAFALMNSVRAGGKQRLGLSCGLFGTGMAFSRELLEREPWAAAGLAEDREYHMRLVYGGGRAEFVPEAWVSSAMPTSLRGGSDQQARWERGRLGLVAHWSPRLIVSGLAKRDLARVHAGAEQLVPPQSLIVAGSIGSVLGGLLLGSRRLVSLSALTLLAQGAFVLVGLRLVGAPRRVYRALLLAPALILAKLALYVRLLLGRGPTAWVRTEREAPVASALLKIEREQAPAAARIGSVLQEPAAGAGVGR
jgi:hypothetical protein